MKIRQPTEQHWTLFQPMLRSGSATANLVFDAHLAALAVEHNCVRQSTGRGFARFRGLTWKNPLEEK